MGCGFFACISGSDAADAAAIGRITMKRLVERGYPLPYACALVAAGACTGILIPPSIAYIIIGRARNLPATLFLAFVPTLPCSGVMLTNAPEPVHRYENSRRRFSWRAWFGTERCQVRSRYRSSSWAAFTAGIRPPNRRQSRSRWRFSWASRTHDHPQDFPPCSRLRRA